MSKVVKGHVWSVLGFRLLSRYFVRVPPYPPYAKGSGCLGQCIGMYFDMVVIGNGCVLIIYVVDVMPPYRMIYLRWRSSFGGGVFPLQLAAGLGLTGWCSDVSV